MSQPGSSVRRGCGRRMGYSCLGGSNGWCKNEWVHGSGSGECGMGGGLMRKVVRDGLVRDSGASELYL